MVKVSLLNSLAALDNSGLDIVILFSVFACSYIPPSNQRYLGWLYENKRFLSIHWSNLGSISRTLILSTKLRSHVELRNAAANRISLSQKKKAPLAEFSKVTTGS